MSTISTFKSGFFDFGYIKNRGVRSMRKGDQGKLISSAAALDAKLHYDQYRPQEIVNDAQSTAKQPLPTTDSRPNNEPESALADKLGYDQYRPEFDRTSRQRFANRPLIDHGLGANEVEIIDHCKRWASPYAIAYSYIISVHPLLIVILRQHGIDAEKFTETYAVDFIQNFLEAVGCDATIEMSMVIHYVETTAGLPHIHAHVTTPGTGYDVVTDTRVPIPKITPEMLAEGQAIADRTAELAMDRVLTRAWRLEVPELASTFYDPVDLPRPEPSSELDSWFPRPKIPASALLPRLDAGSADDRLFPNGLWEVPTSFGESAELAQLVDSLFADVTFESSAANPALTAWLSPASASVEADERGVLTYVSLPDLPAEWQKLDTPASIVAGSVDPQDDLLMAAENVPVITAQSNGAPDTMVPSYPVNAPEDDESIKAIIELWPRLRRPDSTDLDSQSVEIGALVDTFLPASLWTVADGFGDADRVRQIDELFAAIDLAIPPMTERDGIDFNQDTDEIELSPVEVSAEPDTELDVEREPELDYRWWYAESTRGHEVAYRIIPAWNADLHEGHLTLAVDWHEPEVEEWSTVQTTIFHNTPLDYLHLDKGSADLTAAEQEAKTAFEGNLAYYHALPEPKFNKMMYASFGDWMRTTALDKTAKARGFLPNFPGNMLPFDPAEETANVDPLPEGVTWLGSAETDKNALRWGIITRPDRDDILRVYAIKQWVDEHGSSHFILTIRAKRETDRTVSRDNAATI